MKMDFAAHTPPQIVGKYEDITGAGWIGLSQSEREELLQQIADENAIAAQSVLGDE
jgi:hypothetical protein